MLTQNQITWPVFDSLFIDDLKAYHSNELYSYTEHIGKFWTSLNYF